MVHNAFQEQPYPHYLSGRYSLRRSGYGRGAKGTPSGTLFPSCFRRAIPWKKRKAHEGVQRAEKEKMAVKIL